MGLLLCLMSSPAFGAGCCVVPFDDEIVKSGAGGLKFQGQGRQTSPTKKGFRCHRPGVSDCVSNMEMLWHVRRLT